MTGVELVVSAVLPVLLDKLASSELRQFLHRESLYSKIKTWEDTLMMIQTVLRDAEEKQLMQENVKKWLDDLEDLAYDVEDILDEFATDVLLRDLKKKQHEQASTSKFHKLVSTKISKLSPKAIKSRVRMGSEIKNVKCRVEHVTGQLARLCKLKDSLGLKEIVGGTLAAVPQARQLTTSFPTERVVYGRDKDKAKILEMVCSDQPSTANFHVITVVGMGGIGKTTLVQKVFNDEAVESFKLKAWVCVSNDFDVLRISKAILENIGQPCNLNDLNAVQKKLQQEIDGKKFLFVLDDVWSNNSSPWKTSWDTLISPFAAGARESKIIVTTRNEAIALDMRSSTWLYKVQLLSNDECWSLFKAHAFYDGVNPTHPNIQSIREEVIEKSKGLPLASKVLGGLLYKKSIDEWLEILNSKMWDLVDGSDIPATLKLSYFYLRSHLKRCFAYCSIFSEDYEFEEEELIHLWLTEGLIQPSNKQLEDSGYDYFNDLLSSSLFQQSSSNKAKYVMHDLVRDLAQWASRGTCFHLADMSSVNEQLESLEKTRHLSYGQGYLDGKCKFEVFSKVERVEQRLRTFLPLDTKRETSSYISPTVVSDLLPKFKKLRMLSLENYQITELPESIGDLRHLRHLNLYGTRIKHLPESTSSLINLLILKLKGCSRLKKLPSEMKNLTKLRYLDIRDVDLDEMPLGIDELKHLRYLSNFIVDEGVGATLKVLKNLKYLCEEICISRLENVVDLDEINEMILNHKQKLRVLKLEWNSQFDDTRNANKEKKVLNLLQPHRGLERLTIESYGGIEFPSWVGASSFFKLTILTLESCVSCTILPSLGLLESLKDLTIRGMKGLKRIGNEFCGQQCSKPFRSLETLCFEDLQEWKHWEPIKENDHGVAFPCLQEFSIQNCPKLCGSLPSRLHSMEKFVIEHCPQLMVSFSSLPKLCNLDITRCREMTCVDPIDLKSLKSITLSNIEEFGDWAEQDCFQKTELLSFPVICYFSNLCELEITYCNALTSLPMEMNHRNTCLESLKLSNCESLKFIINGPLPSSLKRLEIDGCDKLEYLWDDREVSCTSVVDKENHTFVLEYLGVYSCTSLTNLSLSGRLPTTLSYLSLWRLPELESIADSFHDNISLEEIKIENCEKLTTISNGLHNCSRLQEVEIEDCESIVKLAEDGLPKDKLSRLCIRNCEKLEGLPKGFHSLDSLEDLTLYECPSMRSFPEEGFPTSLTSLNIDGEVNIYKQLLEWGLHNLTILKTLSIFGRPKAESSFVEQEMGMRLPLSLTRLLIHQFPNSKWVLSQDFRNLNSLESLEIRNCPGLASFPKVALPSSLQSLDIRQCPALTSISELGLPSSLQSLNIQEFPALTSISELGLPSSLQSLDILDFSALTSISELDLPSSLQSLVIRHCPALTSISKLGLPSSLLKLSIAYCSNLRFLTKQCLPSSLLELDIDNCAMLKEECKRDKRKVWPNISHIPRVAIDGNSIDELEDVE